MRVTDDECALRLRRIGIEDRIDRIGVGRLKPGVLLKAVPDAVLRIDGVIDLHHDEVFAVAVVERGLSLVRAAVAICVPETGTRIGTGEPPGSGNRENIF